MYSAKVLLLCAITISNLLTFSYANDCYSETPWTRTWDNEVKACKENATSSLCWPTNGTRICVPSTIRMEWPTIFYEDQAKVEVRFSLANTSIPMPRYNYGYGDVDFTMFEFLRYGMKIPSSPDERSLKIYMAEHPVDKNAVAHEGPTLILVETPAASTATGTSGTSSQSGSDDGKPRLSPGAIAGIAIGAVVALAALVICCNCWCCTKRTGKLKGRHNGAPLTEMSGVYTSDAPPPAHEMAIMGSRANEAELRRLEEAIVARRIAENDARANEIELRRDDPPPKYTP